MINQLPFTNSYSLFMQRHTSHAHSQSDDDEDEETGLKPSKKRTRKRLNSSAMDLDDSQAQQNDDDDDDDDDSEDYSMAEDGASKDAGHMAQTPPCSPVKSLNNSSSPVGVNRR